MPLIRADGTVKKRTVTEIIDAGKTAAKQQFGLSTNVRGTGTTRKFLEAGVALGMIEIENAFEDNYRQRFSRWATGQALDDSLWPLFERLPTLRATGTITLTLTSALASPATLFAVGSLEFFDSSGIRFILTEDVLSNGTTTVTAKVRCDQLGTVGNVGEDEIEFENTAFADPTTETNWTTWVDSFTNEAFANGRDTESDIDFRLRAGEQRTAKPGSSPDGIAVALLLDSGVVAATVIENTDDDATQEDTLGSGTGTGTDSENIDGTTLERIAFPFTPGDTRYAQFFTVLMNHASGTPEYTVQIEGNSPTAGPGGTTPGPDGTPADPRLVLTGFQPADGSATQGKFDRGVFLDEDTPYWLVLYQTDGSANVDGEDGGGNAVDNGGFETYNTSPGAPSAWNEPGDSDGTFELETTIFDEGTNAVKITANTTSARAALQSDDLDLQPGVLYRVSARHRTAGNAGELGRVGIYNVTDAVMVDEDTGTDATTSFETLTFDFVPESGKVYAIYVEINDTDATASDIVYFDDVQVYPVGAIVYDGANWDEDANITEGNFNVKGGIPPRAFRAYVSGGDADDIAQILWDTRAAGIYSDGANEGTATGVDGFDHTERFERPTLLPLLVKVSVQVTSAFDLTEDDIKNAITSVIGGTGTDGAFYSGAGVGNTLVLNEIIHALQDDEILPGYFDTTALAVDIKADVTDEDPANVSPSATNNIVATAREEVIIQNATTDIDVTIQVI